MFDSSGPTAWLAPMIQTAPWGYAEMDRQFGEGNMSDFSNGGPPVAGRFEGTPQREEAEPPAPKRGRGVLLALVLVAAMLASAFGLGVGVMRAVEGEEPSQLLRSPRGVTAVPTERLVPRAQPVAGGQSESLYGILDEIHQILHEEFVEPETFNAVEHKRAAINGLLDALGDEHTAWIPADVYHQTREDISGSFEGIGSTVNQNAEGEIVVVQPFDGSPAETAGLRAGDVILEVDGESISGWSLQETVNRIRGPRGTVVVLRVRRVGGAEEDIPITRDRIIVPSVRSAQIADRAGEPVLDIGYIRIQQFTPRTVAEVGELLDAAETSGITKLIIDLRNNPGGLVSATVDTTGLFMDQGVVMRQVNRSGDERTYEDSAGGAGLDFEIAILINEGAASGSEVMAAALRDHGRAVLIGQTTIGKGTVNIERPLSDGSVLYVSIARWLSPDRQVIEGVGVAPDIEVVQPKGGLTADNDLALLEAIDYLRGQSGAGGAAEEDDDDSE